MMPFRTDAEGELGALEETTRRFVEREIAPLEPELRRTGAVGITSDMRRGLQAKAKAAGLWCFLTPEEYGGAGLRPTQMVGVYEQAVRHTYSLPDPGDGAFGYDPPNFLLGADPEQRERYLLPSVEQGHQWFVAITEPSGGSDPARSIRTSAIRGGAGWVLNGRKQFISRVHEARQGIVLARTGEGRDGITAFIVRRDSPGFSYREVGVIRDHNTYEITLEDVDVPEEDVLGEVGRGFALAQGWLARGRLALSARSLGVAQMALDMAVQYAGDRVTFGRPLSERQGIQWMLADSAIALHAARLVVRDAAATVEHAGKDALMKTSASKLMATETAFIVVDRAIQVHGGIGLCEELPLEHWFRALRVNRIVEGASEVQRLLVARELFGSARSA
jgi:acyl-CoA dehydrogenase